MSILETPRILFRGEIAWDPITTNNYDTMYEEAAAHPLPVSDTVAQFRQQAIDAVQQSVGSWNPHGTHRSSFFDTYVAGVDLGQGPSDSDPFAGVPVGFTGMLVDLEPYGAFTSQLYFDSISLGIEGGCRIYAPRNARMTARYVNFGRNRGNAMIAGLASVVWQTSFSKSAGLIVDAHGSPGLEAISQALADPDILGLTLRLNTYRTVYYDCLDLPGNTPLQVEVAQRLIDKLNSGGWQPNPARSLVVGQVGLWRRGEPVDEPGDRTFVSQCNLFDKTAPYVATAFARMAPDNGSITLDLSNSMPENDVQATKVPLGPLDLVFTDNQGQQQVLARLEESDYDRAAYLAGCGLVTLKTDSALAAQAAQKDISLVGTGGGGQPVTYLTEQALRAIPIQHNVYMNEGETGNPAMQVYARGVPAGGGIPILVVKTDYSGGEILQKANIVTDAAGTANLHLIAGPGDIYGYMLLAGPNPQIPPHGIDPQVSPYLYVRALPLDADTAALEPTWDNVFAKVLSNWKAMAPCMDNWLDLEDPLEVKRFAPVLKKLTDPTNWELYRYMPVTRDMTEGERTLLYRFLDAPDVPATLKAGFDAAAEMAGDQPASGKSRMVRLSQATRNH